MKVRFGEGVAQQALCSLLSFEILLPFYLVMIYDLSKLFLNLRSDSILRALWFWRSYIFNNLYLLLSSLNSFSLSLLNFVLHFLWMLILTCLIIFSYMLIFFFPIPKFLLNCNLLLFFLFQLFFFITHHCLFLTIDDQAIFFCCFDCDIFMKVFLILFFNRLLSLINFLSSLLLFFFMFTLQFIFIINLKRFLRLSWQNFFLFISSKLSFNILIDINGLKAARDWIIVQHGPLWRLDVKLHFIFAHSSNFFLI